MGVKKSGSLRAEQSELTRHRILEAAEVVFGRDGFSGARIEDVAEEAGVAVPTVYKVFTNKRNLLVGALNRAMTGGDDGSIDAQAWWTEQLDEGDPVRQLELIARNARRIYDRAGSMLEVVRAAATVDADLASAWQAISDDRRARARKTAKQFLPRAGKRARLGAEETALSLLTLTGVELYTAHRGSGRSPEQYERWLANLLRTSLLADA